MTQDHSFGYWLRLKRKSYDLTREALADRVGCSAALIRKIEAEERRPSSQIVQRLAEIFDIPPSEFDSFLLFARNNVGSSHQKSVEFSPWNISTIQFRSNLPSPASSLIGREQEISLVQGYLRSENIRLVTLVGPPGTGKTRLSLETARNALPDFPDGIFFAALAELKDPDSLPSVIGQAIGYVESKGLSITNQLITGIGKKKVLLVLDNCEHMIEAVAKFSNDLLSACPQLKILATSREALHIPGEWLYSVPALGFPKDTSAVVLESITEFPALVLFAERARSVRSDFELNENNIQSVASICAQLDGLPLAIELIATRIRMEPPNLLLRKMTDHFILSADGMRAVAPRHKSLNNAIGWSFNTLSIEEQNLFSCLSVFSGGFTLEAVESIFSTDFVSRSVPHLLALLLEKSLLQPSFDTSGEIRYVMLATIRRFALKSLHLLGNEAVIRDRHLAFFLDLAEKGAGEMRSQAQVAWSQCLENERYNFHTALDWAVSSQKTESALRLLYALGWPWEIRSHYREARIWLDRICALPDIPEFPAIHARLLNHIGRHSWIQGDIQDARSLFAESQAISQKIGGEGEPILAETLNWLGLIVLLNEKDPNKAKPLFEQSLALSDKWGNQMGIALSTFHLGIVESELDRERAFNLFNKSLSMFRQVGDLFFIARVSIFLGYLYLQLEEYDQARKLYEDQLRIDQQLNYWDGIAGGWVNLGNLYRHQGHFDQSNLCYEESLALCIEHGLNEFDPGFMSGVLALDRNDYALAFQRFTLLLEKTMKHGQPESRGILMTGLAAVAAGNNDPERAARLSGASQKFHQNIGESQSAPEYNEFSQLISKVKDQLGDKAFVSLQNEGRLMTMEQAIAYAIGASLNSTSISSS